MDLTTNYIKHVKSKKHPVNNFFLNYFSKTVVKEAKKLRPRTVLDVGCGEGFILANLKQNKVGKEHEGIEYVDKAIKLAKQLYPTLKILKGNIYKLPYQDNSFDLVLCTEVLEHLDYPERALKELLRVTKKHLLLTVPNEPYFTIQRVLRGKNILELGDHPEHIQHWSSRSFKKFVQKQAIVKKIKRPLPWTLIIARKY